MYFPIFYGLGHCKLKVISAYLRQMRELRQAKIFSFGLHVQNFSLHDFQQVSQHNLYAKVNINFGLHFDHNFTLQKLIYINTVYIVIQISVYTFMYIFQIQFTIVITFSRASISDFSLHFLSDFSLHSGSHFSLHSHSDFSLHFPQISVYIFFQISVYISLRFQFTFSSYFSLDFSQISVYISRRFRFTYLRNFSLHFAQISVYISQTKCKLKILRNVNRNLRECKPTFMRNEN